MSGGWRSAQIVGIVVAFCGCAGTVSWLSPTRYSRPHTDRAPTGKHLDRIEYRSDSLATTLRCFATTRSIDRTRAVTKTYRRRGGLAPATYYGLAAVDGVMAALVGGVAAGVCLQGDSRKGCWHILWAAPFAIDMVYGLIKGRNALNPVLIEKAATSSDALALGTMPLVEETSRCDQVVQVQLGVLSGNTDEERLNYGRSELRTVERATAVPLGPDRELTLTTNALEAWIADGAAILIVTDTKGESHPITGPNRCEILRHEVQRIRPGNRGRVFETCPAPKPQQR